MRQYYGSNVHASTIHLLKERKSWLPCTSTASRILPVRQVCLLPCLNRSKVAGAWRYPVVASLRLSVLDGSTIFPQELSPVQAIGVSPTGLVPLSSPQEASELRRDASGESCHCYCGCRQRHNHPFKREAASTCCSERPVMG